MIQTIKELETILREQKYSRREIEFILTAARRSDELHRGQLRASGLPYIVHPLQVCETLIEMHLDSQTLVAGLLHDSIEDTAYSRQDLTAEFGKKVAALVEGVTKIGSIQSQDKTREQTSTIRKMLLATTEDIRVIFIKLADKLNNMRTLEFKKPDRIRVIAQECLDIYAPLAHRLGINWIKAELEDLSLKHLEPDSYKRITEHINQKKSERSKHLELAAEEIKTLARSSGLQIQTASRAKHFYSIYSKMKDKGLDLSQIYDFLGLRVICKSQSDCYIMLGIIHNMWKPLNWRFKDYIAMPKSNRYQSLHTTVMAHKQMLEVQIRTQQMDQTAEHGIAAHWLYKSKGKNDYDDLAIINNLKNLDHVDDWDFFNEMKNEILGEIIYVFTPKGDIIELPKGSTPIDFAYHIHSEIGSHSSSAKADGSIIPLRQSLKNSQVVEIITHPKAQPRLDWLRFVKTRGARSKIRAWINKHDESLFVDRNIVARQKSPQRSPSVPRKKPTGIDSLKSENAALSVGKEKDLLVHFAQCCKPLRGDDIVGYISRGRGIIIHKKSCRNFINIHDVQERSIEVEWESPNPRIRQKFIVTAGQSQGLIGDIENAIRKSKGNLIEIKLDHSDSSKPVGHVIIEVDESDKISRILKSINSISKVHTVAQDTHNG